MSAARQALSPGIYRCRDLPGWWCLLGTPVTNQGYVQVGLMIPRRNQVLIQGYVTATNLVPREDIFESQPERSDQILDEVV